MKRYKSIVPHAPSRGLYGDCYRTVIGCLLDMPPDQVPHFLDGYAEDWIDQRDTWLAERGLKLVNIFIEPPQTPLEDGKVGLEALLWVIGEINQGTYYILCGDTIDGIGHTVVCCGGKIVHNPSPVGCPIVAPVDGMSHYELQFLVPISMDAAAHEGGIIKVAPLEGIPSEFVALTSEELTHIRRRRRYEHEANRLVSQDQEFAMRRIRSIDTARMPIA